MSVTSRMLILPRYQPSIECSATNLLVYEDCRLKPAAFETLKHEQQDLIKRPSTFRLPHTATTGPSLR